MRWDRGLSTCTVERLVDVVGRMTAGKPVKKRCWSSEMAKVTEMEEVVGVEIETHGSFCNTCWKWGQSIWVMG